MNAKCLVLILLVAMGAFAQTSPPLRTIKTAAPPEVTARPCASIEKQYKAVKSGIADTSPANLFQLDTVSQACLQYLFAQLNSEQQMAAKTAFKLYQKVNSEVTAQVRLRDDAEMRALAARETHDGNYRLASLFGRYAELSYRYDQLLDDVNRYLRDVEKFSQTVEATSSVRVPLPPPLTLPDKVEFLNCSDYDVGRFSACWPPDDD